MPEYAPDLTDYAATIGHILPEEAAEDKAFLRRCLSKESPISLVGLVAHALKDADKHPVLEELSLFERGRVMTALGRARDAEQFYRDALESADPETRKLILVNLANEVQSPEEKESLLRQAISEGYDEALVHLGLFLFQQGKTAEAEHILLESVRKGVNMGISLLVRIYYETKERGEFASAIIELFTAAQEAGISDMDLSFARLLEQALVTDEESGQPVNALASLCAAPEACEKNHLL